MDKRTIDVNGIIFNMLPVEGGQFVMGATSEQHGDAYDNEAPAHSVRVDDYYLGETVVTQALWDAVMDDTTEENPELPVTGKSWSECQAFIRKLNDLTSRHFRMPTEAEWEYAARGGKKGRGCKYAGSNNLDDVAWYDKNSGRVIHPAKQKRPNELGLYDMSGNVWEWCADWYGEYERAEEGEEETAHNPQGPRRGSQRVVRGASNAYYAQSCRVSCRLPLEPLGGNYGDTGLRLAMDENDPIGQTKVGSTTVSETKESPQLNSYMGGTTGDGRAKGKDTKDSNGHYWKPTGGGRHKKKKVWPWLVGAGVAVIILIVVIASGGGNETLDDMPQEEVQPTQQIDVNEGLRAEISNKIVSANQLFDENQLKKENYWEEDHTNSIERLDQGWVFLMEADSLNQGVGDDDANNQIEKCKDKYIQHIAAFYALELDNLVGLKKDEGKNRLEIEKGEGRLEQLERFSGRKNVFEEVPNAVNEIITNKGMEEKAGGERREAIMELLESRKSKYLNK